MTGTGDNDQSQPDGTQEPAPTPQSSRGAWEGLQPRVTTLEAWIVEHQAAFTSEALERSAIESGYTKAEFDEAARLAGRRERENQVVPPLKARARIVVIIAYVLVWLVFARIFLLPDSYGYYGLGPTMQLILTMTLVVAIALSMVWIHVRRPDPDHVALALASLLVVPIVLLVGVAGLCLPFTSGSVL
jgi:hypothetical protein